MYGRILRQLRESKGRTQAEVARVVGISAPHLARLEASKRGLYVEDFVAIAEALGEKPGNLLPNELGDIAHLKPLIDRLAAMSPEFLPPIAAILDAVVVLKEDITAMQSKRRKEARPVASRKGRRS